MKRRPREIETKIRRRGKPSTDSIVSADQITGRIKEWCDMVLRGMPPFVAGELLNPIAKEQQVKVWMKNEGARNYLASRGGGEGRFDEDKLDDLLVAEMRREIIKDITRKARNGEVVDPRIYMKVVEDLSLSEIVPPGGTSAAEEKEKKEEPTILEWFKQQENKK